MPRTASAVSSACSAAATPTTSQQSVQFVQGWLRTSASRSRSRSCPRTRSPRSSARATSTCSSGAGSSSPTRTTSSRPSPAPTARTRTAAAIYANLSDSFYCNPAYDAARTPSSRRRSTPAERAAIVKQMQKMLYDDAPYVDHGLLRQPRGLPLRPFTGFRPQPSRTARCCSSTAPTATRASTGHGEDANGSSGAAARRRPATSSSNAPMIAIGVVVLVVLGVGGFAAGRAAGARSTMSSSSRAVRRRGTGLP